MQAQHSKDIVKDVVSAAQLEAELGLSQAQHGVAVLDVYNAEWGSTKTLGETFRRLFTDAGDAVHLRFFSVECNSVMESLNNPEEAKAVPRARGVAYRPDTQPAHWGPLLEARRRHSKPFFAFYKEGKMRGLIEGIDTPRICRLVQDLCRQQTPATDHLTNVDGMRFWELHFSLSDSEVPIKEVTDALQKEAAHNGQRALLRGDVEQFSKDVSAKESGIVTAAAFQSWLGDSATVEERTAELLQTAPPAPAQEEEEEEAASRTPEKPEEDQDAAASVHSEARGTRVGTPEGSDEQHPEASNDEATPGVGETDGQDDESAENGQAEDVPREPEQADSELPVDEGAVDELGDNEAAESDLPASSPPEAEAAADVVAADDANEHEELATSHENESQLETEAAEATPTDDIPPLDDHSPEKERSAHEEGGTADEAPPVEPVHQIFTDHWITVNEAEMNVWNAVAALTLHYPDNTTVLLLPCDEAENRAAALLPEDAASCPTLTSYLETTGMSADDISMMCLAADQKVGSDSLSLGKLALIILCSGRDDAAALIREPDEFRQQLSAGTILSTHAPLALTALCLCVSETDPDEVFYYIPPAGAPPFSLEEGHEYTLSALSPLSANMPAADTPLFFTIAGLPEVIELATTDDCEDTMVVSQWFSKLRVTKVDGAEVALTFVETVHEEAFAAFSDAYIARLADDEGQLDKKGTRPGFHADEEPEEFEEAGEEEEPEQAGQEEAGSAEGDEEFEEAEAEDEDDREL